MSYQRKVHLYGDPCPSAPGTAPATVLPLANFLRAPPRQRCLACNKRAITATDNYPSGVAGPQAQTFPPRGTHG